MDIAALAASDCNTKRIAHVVIILIGKPLSTIVNKKKKRFLFLDWHKICEANRFANTPPLRVVRIHPPQVA